MLLILFHKTLKDAQEHLAVECNYMGLEGNLVFKVFARYSEELGSILHMGRICYVSPLWYD